MSARTKRDWVESICDTVEQHVGRVKCEQASIVCASGISPSGPVHLGNLREIMTPYLVAEELRARGRQVEYLHFWDDYDRLRKIPAGVSPEFAQHLGRPLCDIPDPSGKHESYAARYISEFTTGLEQLGIFPRYVCQSAAYRSGMYTQYIKEALAQRGAIFDILATYQTRQGQQAAQAEQRAAYYPYRVYCEQ
jgi:lysyl-tRNA synthetase class 1